MSGCAELAAMSRRVRGRRSADVAWLRWMEMGFGFLGIGSLWSCNKGFWRNFKYWRCRDGTIDRCE